MDIDEDDDFYAPDEPEAPPAQPAAAAAPKAEPADELEEGEEEDEGGAMDEDDDSARTQTYRNLLCANLFPGHRHNSRVQGHLQSAPSIVSCAAYPPLSPCQLTTKFPDNRATARYEIFHKERPPTNPQSRWPRPRRRSRSQPPTKLLLPHPSSTSTPFRSTSPAASP